MNRANVAVKDDPAPRCRAWIWFEDKVPTESESACAAHLVDEEKTWDLLLFWEGAIKLDEIVGEVSWYGPELKAGDILRLCEGDQRIGMVRILGEVE